MTKHDLVNELSAELGITKKLCNETLDVMVEEIVRALETGGKYMQPGFGTFKTADSNPRIRRNPATGRKMLYPKKRRLKFRVSETLKDEINE